MCVDSVYDAVYQLVKYEFTLIILDASLTVKDGSELLDAIQRATSTPILILSLRAGKVNNDHKESYSNTDTLSDQQCSLKNSLALAQHLIRSETTQVAQGEYCYTLAFGNDLIIEPDKRQVYLKGKKLNLTRKEFDMLLCLASNAGKVLTREQLYNQIWENDTSYNVDDLVKAHIKTLRKKLSEADIKYIKNVWGVGYRFDHETEKDGE